MPNLFLDIETAPIFSTVEEYFRLKKAVDTKTLNEKSNSKDLYWKIKRGGLRPFGSKVILITYQINDAHLFRLKEWELGEEKLLKKFYNLLVDLQRGSGDDRLRVIGHNILRFDLFFLYERMRQYNADDEQWLHQYVINKPEVIDFLQMHLPLNDFETKGLRHDVLAHAYGFPTKTTLGSEEISHYYGGDYDKIIEYSEREFIYPELYKKIKTGGMISKERLKEAIKWYENEQNDS